MQVEKSVRDEGLLYVERHLKKEFDDTVDLLMDEDHLVNYFGETYASDPSNFRFEIGDKKLIKYLRDHIQDSAKQKGNKYLRRFCKRGRKRTQKKSHKEAQKELNSNDQNEVNNENYPPDDENYRRIEKYDQLRGKLFNGVNELMQSFVIDDSILESFNLNSVSVKMTDGKIYGEIICAVCENDPKKKRKIMSKRVFYENGNGSKFWVLANFKKHLKNVHKLELAEHPKFDGEESDRPLSMLKKKTASRTKTKHEVDSPELDGNLRNIDTFASDRNFTVEIVDVPIYSSNYEFDSSFGTTHENAMFHQISEQIKKMLEATLTNNDVTEDMSFSFSHENSHTLTVAKIEKDGSCLFRSLEHQLSGRKVNTREQTHHTQQLRKNVVEYISDHHDSFRQALKSRVYEEMDESTVSDMDKECKKILDEYLPNDFYWGGAETLKAVKEMFDVNILTFDEKGQCRFFNQFTEANNRTLILAYRINPHRSEKVPIRYHYDSVCDIPSSAIVDSIKYLSMFLHKESTHDTTL